VSKAEGTVFNRSVDLCQAFDPWMAPTSIVSLSWVRHFWRELGAKFTSLQDDEHSHDDHSLKNYTFKTFFGGNASVVCSNLGSGDPCSHGGLRISFGQSTFQDGN